MIEETQQLIQQRFGEVPVAVQSALLGPNFSQMVATMSQNHNIQEQDVRLVENEIVLVLMAFEPLENLTENFIDNIHLDASVAESLATDVRNELFSTEIVSWLRDISIERQLEETQNVESSQEEQLQTGAPNSAIHETPQGLPTHQMPEHVLDESAEVTDPNVAVADTDETAANAVPRYSKPLTDTPRYDDDPYREPVA